MRYRIYVGNAWRKRLLVVNIFNNRTKDEKVKSNDDMKQGPWSFLEHRFLPPYVWEADLLTFWRERILFFILFTSSTLGLIALVPSLALSIAEDRWEIVALDLLAYGTAVGLLFGREILSYRNRARISVLLIYVLGLELTIVLGWFGAAYIWLFAAAIMAGALIGFRASIVILILNLAGLLMVGFLVAGGYVQWAEPEENTTKIWMVMITNFMVANALASITTALMLGGLKDALAKEYEVGQQVRRSEEKYRGIFDGSGEGIAVIQDEKPVFINNKLIEMAGYPGVDLKERPFLDWFHHDDRDNALECFEESPATPGRATLKTVRLKGENESFLWVDVSAAPFLWEGRQACLAFFRDVSERIAADEEHHRLEDQLHHAQKMEAVGTLSGGISHDFNNLLQVINGYAQLLLMDKSENSQEYHFLKAIQGAGVRASDLVRQLLLFSRKADATKRAVALKQEVEQAQTMLERTIPKMIRIQVIAKDGLWTINADPVQIEQMLLNLGTNAADAMPDGGKLVFEIGNITLDDDFANRHLGAEPGRYLLLTVADTGQGMDQDTMNKIFDPFFTTKDFGKGTGLGLASVYGIVKSHGGYINCYSEIGKGTTFKIYFPAIVQPEVKGTDNPDPELPSRGVETVLLVDDDEAIRDYAQQALMKFGYTALTASSGEETLEIYPEKSNEIDIIVMDIGMPGMGGHKCLQELQKINPAVKVVIASGYAIDDRVKKSLDSGAAGYLGKPYQLTDLLNTVRAVLDGQPISVS